MCYKVTYCATIIGNGYEELLGKKTGTLLKSKTSFYNLVGWFEHMLNINAVVRSFMYGMVTFKRMWLDVVIKIN